MERQMTTAAAAAPPAIPTIRPILPAFGPASQNQRYIRPTGVSAAIAVLTIETPQRDVRSRATSLSKGSRMSIRMPGRRGLVGAGVGAAAAPEMLADMGQFLVSAVLSKNLG